MTFKVHFPDSPTYDRGGIESYPAAVRLARWSLALQGGSDDAEIHEVNGRGSSLVSVLQDGQERFISTMMFRKYARTAQV
jgi:hypothetical protein